MTAKTHGHTLGRKGEQVRSPTYNSWRGMMDRCQPDAPYGKRGVTVCERWRTFANFLEDMGERPEGTEIDRKEVLGNYEPSNCQWLETRPNRQKNRLSPMTPEKRTRASELKAQGVTYPKIAAELGVKEHSIVQLFRKKRIR